ncbi:single-stranded DNA-binding protein, partial [Solihabitans fulvus]
MNEQTIHGHITADPVIRFAKSGCTVATFTIAVNRRRYTNGSWSDLPTVFHNVVCFAQLADNVGATLHKGFAVTVSGEWGDDSYTPDGSDRIIRRIKFEANDVAVSLRFATAALPVKSS